MKVCLASLLHYLYDVVKNSFNHFVVLDHRENRLLQLHTSNLKSLFILACEFLARVGACILMCHSCSVYLLFYSLHFSFERFLFLLDQFGLNAARDRVKHNHTQKQIFGLFYSKIISFPEMSSAMKMAFFANLRFTDTAILKGQLVLLKVLQYTVGVFTFEQN